jgi:hypothetical protein
MASIHDHDAAAEITEPLKSEKHLDRGIKPQHGPRQSITVAAVLPPSMSPLLAENPRCPTRTPRPRGHLIWQAACRIRSRRTSPLRAVSPADGHLRAVRCPRLPRSVEGGEKGPATTVIVGRASFPTTCSSSGEAEGGVGGGAMARFPGARVALRGATQALAATETAGGGSGRGALGRHPEQPHPARVAEAPADPFREPSTTRGGKGKGGGSGGTRAKGDGAAHGVERLVEPAAACIVTHGVAGGRRRGAEGGGGRIEWGRESGIRSFLASMSGLGPSFPRVQRVSFDPKRTKMSRGVGLTQKESPLRVGFYNPTPTTLIYYQVFGWRNISSCTCLFHVTISLKKIFIFQHFCFHGFTQST